MRTTICETVGVGVGAVIVDEDGQILLIRRGRAARNEQGQWACPGGALACGETLAQAICREVWEECGIAIAVLCQLGAFDHLLPNGEQWISIAYLAQVVAGSPSVQEPDKCSACQWFAPDALPEPISPLALTQLAASRRFVSRIARCDRPRRVTPGVKIPGSVVVFAGCGDEPGFAQPCRPCVTESSKRIGRGRTVARQGECERS